jgi:tRNA A37 methylthiotransferase MiaB
MQDDVSEQERKPTASFALMPCKGRLSAQKPDHIGQIHRVLIEKAGTRKNPRDWQARNDGNKIVVLPPAPLQVGEFIDARILRASAHSLRGELV